MESRNPLQMISDQIKSVITNNEDKYDSKNKDNPKVNYRVYFNGSKTEKETTKRAKEIIHRIAYELDQKQIITEIEQALSVFKSTLPDVSKEKSLSKMLSEFDEILAFIEKLKQANNEASLLTIPKEISNGLVKIHKLLGEAKKLNDQSCQKLRELTLLFEGLHFHLFTAIRRQQINELLKKTTPEVDHPVKEKKRQITLGRKEAILKIGDMEAEESLPVILSLLENIKNTTDLSEAAERTSEALTSALKMLNDANDSLYLSFSELKKKLNEVLAKIVPDSESLVQSISLITVTDENAAYCYQLSFWLEGLYFHTYKDKDAWLDLQAKALSFVSDGKITKLQIAEYYDKAATALRLKLQAYEQSKQENKAAKASPATIQISAEINNNSNVANENEIPASVPTAEKNDIVATAPANTNANVPEPVAIKLDAKEQDKEVKSNVVPIDPDQKDIAQFVSIPKVTETGHGIFDSSLYRKKYQDNGSGIAEHLQKVQDQQNTLSASMYEDLVISTIVYCLEGEFELTPRENNKLRFVAEAIKQESEKYLAGGWINYLKSLTHPDVAKAALAMSQDKTISPTVMLLKLHDLCGQLKGAKESQHLLPAYQSILVKAFNMLAQPLPSNTNAFDREEINASELPSVSNMKMAPKRLA